MSRFLLKGDGNMEIIIQLADLYRKLRMHEFSNNNEWTNAITKANELEKEFKKSYLKKKKQLEKLQLEIEQMEEFIVDSEMEI